jgi:hypothetical protein
VQPLKSFFWTDRTTDGRTDGNRTDGGAKIVV